jgi:hypothetical protein
VKVVEGWDGKGALGWKGTRGVKTSPERLRGAISGGAGSHVNECEVKAVIGGPVFLFCLFFLGGD